MQLLSALENKQVHLWLIDVVRLQSKLQYFLQILSDHEIRRAKRFKFENDRRMFIIAHGVLREILALYLHQQPVTLSITLTDKKNLISKIVVCSLICRILINALRS